MKKLLFARAVSFVVGFTITSLFAMASAHAQTTPSDPRDADMHCALVGMAMVGSASEENSQMARAGTLMTFYYVGRLQGRAPNDNVSSALRQLAPTLTLQQLEVDRPRCVAEISSVAVALPDFDVPQQSGQPPQSGQPHSGAH